MGAQPSTVKKKSFLRSSLIKNKPAGKLTTKIPPIRIQKNSERQDLLRLLSIKIIQSKLRIGQPGDIGELVIFLASLCSDYITGQAINVCGGRSINLS